jgi:hypothetical protein
MEEVSFRTSMTVLGGVIAVAAVIAGVSVLMSQTPAPARPVAVSPVSPARSAVPSSAPPTPAASPARTAPTASAPARTHAPAAPVPETTYPAADEDSTPSRHVAAASGRRAFGRQLNSAAVAAWAAWWRSRLGGLGRHAGGVHIGFGRSGFGGFGHGAGHR